MRKVLSYVALPFLAFLGYQAVVKGMVSIGDVIDSRNAA